jgi:hypothetical protein
MKLIKILERQSLMDLAIEHGGDLDAVFEIMEMNDLSITAELEAGQSIYVPDAINKAIVYYYFNNNIHPASDYIENELQSIIDNNDGSVEIVVNNDNSINIIPNCE